MQKIIDECYAWLFVQPSRPRYKDAMNIARNFAWLKHPMLYPETQRLAFEIEKDDRFDEYLTSNNDENFEEIDNDAQ